MMADKQGGELVAVVIGSNVDEAVRPPPPTARTR